VARQRVQWIEIDIPWCGLVWGTSPCTAALGGVWARKCFQTFATCGDAANFDPGVRTVTLFPDVAGIPVMAGIFPVLQSVRETESTVNIAGADPTISAFGKRATFEAGCRDPMDSDRYFDKYHAERISGDAQDDAVGYQPAEFGTLFRRLKARWPHFAGRDARIKDGWLDGGVLTTEATRHYILTDFETDTPGHAVFKGRDVLDVAGNDRAVCPKASRGKLTLAIDADDTAITLTPAGIGDDDYDASGWATIGSEIVSFTRSADAVTLTGRALFGTAAAGHAALSTFQQAKRYDKVRADLVIADLLTNFAPVPAGYIPAADWADELEFWAPNLFLDAIITKPEQVGKLVAEISIMGISNWWDADNQEVGFRLNRPVAPWDTTWEITDSDIVEGGLKLASKDDKRLTEVLFQTVQIDPTKAIADDNFLRAEYTIDGDAKDPNAYGDSRLKIEKIRWINQGDDSRMRILSLRYLQRFSTAPRHVTVKVRKSSYDGLKLTDVVYLTTSLVTDVTGRAERQSFQVIGKERAGPGLVELTLQRYFYTGRFGYCMPNGTPTYDLASAEEIATGNFAVDEGTLLFPDGTGPYVAI